MTEERAATVLLASENTLFRECLAACLERSGSFQVAGEVVSASELLPQLKRRKPDVLVFDADALGPLPESLLRQIRTRSAGLKILVLASRADEHTVARTLLSGANGVLARGEGLTNFEKALNRVVAGQAWAGREAISKALIGIPIHSRPGSPGLTPRERQLLALLGDGYRNKELATMLRIKEHTVKIHLHSLFRKLNVRTRVEAALKAAELA